MGADHRTPVPVAGAEIRRRATTCGRRRRTADAGAALVTAVVVATVTAGLLSGPDDRARGPAPVATDGTGKPAATVDLSLRRMTVAGRELPVSGGTAQHPTPTGRLTVVARHREKRMPAGDFGLGGEYDLKLPWVIELRTPDGRTDCVVAMTYDEKAPDTRDITRGWIGPRPDDARWLHDRLEPGDVIAVTVGGSGRRPALSDLASRLSDMADPSSYRPKPGQIPDAPGVYKFRDEHRRVIYVGKAKSLRQRLANYFQDLAGLHPRTRSMVTTAASVEWTVVTTEVEALQLEYSWIKEFDPRFNVKYRDDKSYPYLAVTMNEQFPRVQVMRGQKKKGVRYFGPYGHAWAIRDTVDLLLRAFPVRTCSAGVFKNAARTGRPCLLGYIGKCSAPCVERITPEDHRQLAEDFCDFMAGRTGTYIRRLERQMTDAAEEMEYERAARLRDDIDALKKAMEKSAVVLADATDADLIALAEDELEAAVQIFHVRGGRVRGQRGWVTDKVEAVTSGDLVEHALQQLYGEERGDAVPKEVLVPALPDPIAPVQEWLTERRGANVSLRIPQRGDKKALMETVARNAQQSLVLHKTKRASDLTTRSRALEEIAAALDLDSAPLRIECYDISHLQGDDVVASMVVFEDGLARKSEYRRFQIKGRVGDTQIWHGEGQDDVRSMHEVIARRFKRYLAEKEKTGELFDEETGEVSADGGPTEEDGRPKRFSYPPQLVVVDGGQPQVAAAKRALDELGIDDIAVCGLAKRLEEVWVPDEDDPVILPRTSEGLYLLQRVRDEAHRFAITYQRTKRAKRFRAGPLDEVPGLGDARKQTLIKHFGSVKKLRSATIDQICEVPGVGRKTAEAIVVALAQAAPAAPAVNTATGEIMEEEEPVTAGTSEERRGQET